MLTKEDTALVTLMGLAQHYRMKYCHPSQAKIAALSWKIHGVKMSERSLNRYLKSLEDSKTIERVRRISKQHFNNGKFVPSALEINCARPSPRNPEDGRFKTTIYKFTGKAFNRIFLLARKLNNVFKFYRIPEWARRKLQSERDKAAKHANRLPQMAHYNPLRGVSVVKNSPVKVGEVLKTVRKRWWKPSEAT